MAGNSQPEDRLEETNNQLERQTEEEDADLDGLRQGPTPNCKETKVPNPPTLDTRRETGDIGNRKPHTLARPVPILLGRGRPNG